MIFTKKTLFEALTRKQFLNPFRALHGSATFHSKASMAKARKPGLYMALLCSAQQRRLPRFVGCVHRLSFAWPVLPHAAVSKSMVFSRVTRIARMSGHKRTSSELRASQQQSKHLSNTYCLKCRPLLFATGTNSTLDFTSLCSLLQRGRRAMRSARASWKGASGGTVQCAVLRLCVEDNWA